VSLVDKINPTLELPAGDREREEECEESEEERGARSKEKRVALRKINRGIIVWMVFPSELSFHLSSLMNMRR
jgi:hypothetical protein